MTGRSVCGAIALLLMLSSLTVAQGPMMAPGAGYATAWQPQPYAPDYYGPVPSTLGMTPVTPPYISGPANYAWDNTSGDRGFFYEDSPVDEYLKDLATGSFLRFEYMNWTFRDPGGELMGSGVAAVPRPHEPFDVTVGGQLVGEARVATTDYSTLDDINGLRATLGVRLFGGTLEGSIFSFENKSDFLLIDDLGDDPGQDPLIPVQYIATSTLTNGALGTNLLLYDESFQSRFSSDLWSSDINFVFDSYLPDEGFLLRPSIGFRYVDFDEQLLQIGSFNQLGFLVPSLVSTITSNTENRVFVPQIGLRAELTSRWLTVGVEPRIGMGVNVYETNVITERLRSQGDPTINTTESGEEFTVSGEVTVFGRIHVSPRFSVVVSYQAMFVDNVARPHTSIFYNDNGQGQPAAVVTRPAFDLMSFQGINVGGEFRF